MHVLYSGSGAWNWFLCISNSMEFHVKRKQHIYVYWICAKAHIICIYKSWPGTRHSLHYFEIEKSERNERNEKRTKKNQFSSEREVCVVVESSLKQIKYVCIRQMRHQMRFLFHLDVPLLLLVPFPSILLPSIFITFYCDLFYFGAPVLQLACCCLFILSFFFLVLFASCMFVCQHFQFVISLTFCCCWWRRKKIRTQISREVTK